MQTEVLEGSALRNSSSLGSSRSQTRDVPFFNYPWLFKNHENDFLRIFKDVCGRGAFILQKEVKEFEEKLARFTSVKHAIAVANCTDGLFLMLKASGLPSGAEVLISSHTFIATASAIVQAGGVPVPVECGPDHLMDPECLESAVTSRTWAIMPTQLNGRVADMDAICKFAELRGLKVFEDAAQALGAKYHDRQAGSFGLAAAFSFYPAKSLGCLGDGGAIITNDSALYEKIYLMRNHGRGDGTEVLLWGVNSRLDNLQAAILSFLLDDFSNVIEKRRHLARLYHKNLEGILELHLPPGPDEDSQHFDSFQNYEIEAERAEALQIFLKAAGVGTLRQWGGKAVHQFESLNFGKKLPKTELIMSRALMLPLNLAVSEEDVQYVSSLIRQFYERT